MPDYILPFSITREEAEKRIRKRLRKSFFIPWKFKCFKAERISGIYVPFWIYDIFYRDSQLRKNVSALLPVWFLTIRYKDKDYTMMVNGQTVRWLEQFPLRNGR